MQKKRKERWTSASPWKKNDEQYKAHEKKNASHVSLEIKEKRDLIKQRSDLVHIVPHTCTSWSKSMTRLSKDPSFDSTTNAK